MGGKTRVKTNDDNPSWTRVLSVQRFANGTGSSKPFPEERASRHAPAPSLVVFPPTHTHTQATPTRSPTFVSARPHSPVDFRLCRGFLALIPFPPHPFLHTLPSITLPSGPPSHPTPTDGPMVKPTGICRQPHRNSLPSDRRVARYSTTGFAGRHGAGGPAVQGPFFSLSFFFFLLGCFATDGRDSLGRIIIDGTLWRGPTPTSYRDDPGRRLGVGRSGPFFFLFSDVIRGRMELG